MQMQTSQAERARGPPEPLAHCDMKVPGMMEEPAEECRSRQPDVEVLKLSGAITNKVLMLGLHSHRLNQGLWFGPGYQLLVFGLHRLL